jgi:hypothetical protein
MTSKALPIEDELAIRNMFARYGHYLDAGDGPKWAALFTDDGKYVRMNSPPRKHGGSGLPQESIEGREALTKAGKDVGTGLFKNLARHQMTDLFLEAGKTPDEAHGVSRALITDWREGPGKPAMCATYTTHFVRTPQGWRIKSTLCDIIPK